MQSKLGTYLNFCKRAGKLTLGVNAAKATRGKIYLLVADVQASANCKKEIDKLTAKFACPVIWVEGLSDLVNKDACKLAAVAHSELAAAILKQHETQEQ